MIKTLFPHFFTKRSQYSFKIKNLDTEATTLVFRFYFYFSMLYKYETEESLYHVLVPRIGERNNSVLYLFLLFSSGIGLK